jgi:hypothetical protein
MMNREMLETVLARRFPGSTQDQIAAAANAIMGLDDQHGGALTESTATRARALRRTRAAAAKPEDPHGR